MSEGNGGPGGKKTALLEMLLSYDGYPYKML